MDRKFGRRLESLIHERCLYCMQVELLATYTADLCPAYIEALDRIDTEMAGLPDEDAKAAHLRLAMRAFTALVQVKAAVFAGVLNVVDTRLEKARTLISGLTQNDTAVQRDVYPSSKEVLSQICFFGKFFAVCVDWFNC